jgi:ABC-type nitrate/sulfonate/bicarbonate transport system substrate-binding protein
MRHTRIVPPRPFAASERRSSPIVLNEPFRAMFYAPFYIALQRGAFARQGSDLRMVNVGDPNQAAQELLGGTADVGWSGPAAAALITSMARCPAVPLPAEPYESAPGCERARVSRSCRLR